jgi:selenocysteine lyase/cysteine desulfurase
MADRRNFIKNIGGLLGTVALLPFSEDVLSKTSDLFDHSLSKAWPHPSDTDEFWRWVQQQYTSSPNFINLNNGGVSPQPKIVQDAFMRYNSICNEAPSYFMWRQFKRDVDSVRSKLAEFAGVGENEIIINRNTTEALDTIVNGLPLKKGDEVLICEYDYPNMKSVWRMREKRDGIVLKWVSLDIPSEDTQKLVEAYTKHMGPKTKLVHLTHMINWTGQILPVKEIAAEAHKKGIEVLVDGAHTFAHFEYKIPDLDCDYFGTSLHKWLCAPFGTGMLYIRPDKIAKVWPSFPNEEPESNMMSKFENLGTRSVPSEMAIGQALSFHKSIGTTRKYERLHYLKTYWTSKIFGEKKFKLYTPASKGWSGALATVGIEGISGPEVAQRLEREAQIHVTNVQILKVDGVRITPHIYTPEEDLDRLVKALLKIRDSA